MPLGNGLELTWYGHASMLLTTPAGKRILIDPWKTGNPKWPDGVEPGDIDVLLLTHAHSDHLADAIPMAAAGKPDAVICMIELGDYLEGKGVENVAGMNKGGTIEVAGCWVTLVQASHSSSFVEDDGTYVYLGDPVGFMVRTGEVTVYIAGDTCVFGDMALIGRLYKPDVAVLPIGGYFTMDPYEAAEAIRLLGVKKVVPCHDGTFPLLAGHARSAAQGGRGRQRPRGAGRRARRDDPMTFSLVACDLEAGDWGVAVASKFPSVGAVVPWARGNVGAVATQSLANVLYGPEGIERLAAGASAEQVVADLTGPDDMREERQLGVVDGHGGSATFTGGDCVDWAGGRTGPCYAAQGNILTGPRWWTRWSRCSWRRRGRWPSGCWPRCWPPTAPAATGGAGSRRRWSSAATAAATAATTTSCSTCGSTTTPTRCPSWGASTASTTCCSARRRRTSSCRSRASWRPR